MCKLIFYLKYVIMVKFSVNYILNFVLKKNIVVMVFFCDWNSIVRGDGMSEGIELNKFCYI